MWYSSTYRWNNTLSPELDKFHTVPAVPWIGDNEPRSIVGGRVHGTPLFDSGDLGWQDSTAGMHYQLEVYQAEDRARAAAGKGVSHGYQFTEMFRDVSRMYDYVQGFHIIDADDPELLEDGEFAIHRRLTEYLAEPMLERDASLQPWKGYVGHHVDNNFLNNMQAGFVPPAVVLEIIRQMLQLPYEWVGAPID